MNNKHRQDCVRCPHQLKCWSLATNNGKKLSSRNVLINILVCRLQLGINKDDAARMLIELYKPGMMRLLYNAKAMYKDRVVDINEAFNDISSAAIELMQHDYRIGDRGRLTPYLFDPHQGFLTKWVKWYFNKCKKFYSQHELHPTSGSTNSGDDNVDGIDELERSDGGDYGMSSLIDQSRDYGDEENNAKVSEMLETVVAIIEDGVTLNSNEYRVLKFCMQNANELNNTRYIDGLHIYLSKLMGVSRPRCTRLYKRAKQKVMLRYACIVKNE